MLPAGAARFLGRSLGLLFLRLSPRHRRITQANLDAAFPALSPERRAAIARASFAHLGTIAADAPRFPRYARGDLSRIAVYEGVEHLREAAALGRGTLVFSGHYGHWELVALLQARLGWPMTMVVSPMRNGGYERYFARLRGVTGNTILSKRNAARPILKALKEGRSVAILIDQNVRGDGGLFVDFFGRPASTTPSLATLAFRSQAPIVPVFSHFLPDGRLSVSYRPALLPERRATLDEDVRALMQTCTSLLEAEIRARPEEWLWMHDRWRTRPSAAAARTLAAPAEARG